MNVARRATPTTNTTPQFISIHEKKHVFFVMFPSLLCAFCHGNVSFKSQLPADHFYLDFQEDGSNTCSAISASEVVEAFLLTFFSHSQNAIRIFALETTLALDVVTIF